MGLFDGKPIMMEDLPDTDCVVPGVYVVSIFDVTQPKTTAKGVNFFGMTYKIIEGEYKDRMLFDHYIPENGAVLKEILKATDTKELNGSSLKANFLAKEMKVQVTIEEGNRGEQNIVTKRLPVNF